MQMTWRAPDELMERVRRVAEREGRSMNEYVTRVLDAATNPDYAEGDMARLRERLARAGVLAAPGAPRVRPDPEAIAAAAAEAARGTPLSDLIAEGRGPR
ncbi:Arc family DNA-binding protein [Amycolatopsis suaedae]|uniref:Arc family DNA-binding protein n=1 Tax=Amycolatopsis suaedae TaxID=2510978 RepID=A0A4Q7J699_9PSEU|nr:Arc family DNA-binding protein [Amycolatopsis suaedae]RZQ62659.1 Arc family DNA-binding protein [Amycolatopsis suaedae]